MHHTQRVRAALALLWLLTIGAVGAAEARPHEPGALDTPSRGVIVLPGASTARLNSLQPGDTARVSGQLVNVAMSDPAVGTLVRSAALSDAELARTLTAAGVAAEVNYPRHVLPMTPTAELFTTPQAARPEEGPNTPDFWHVEQIGADIVHQSLTTGSAAVLVAIIDTGVYTRHPLLAQALVPGFDFVNNDSEPNDTVGHGTHVAGIVHSICPGCSILPVKVLDYYGGDDYTIARGIRYAQQRGARVIQISLGGPSPSATLCQAIRDVEAQGAEVVIAAGNSAASDTASIGYPGLCSQDSLLVSATDRYDIPAWFSNYGPLVDIAAPGYRVWSSVPSIDAVDNALIAASGTSMAAPQVSGAAALLWSAHPDWTAAQVRDRLTATARAIGVIAGIDDGYGPRVDVAQALGLRSRPVVVGMTVDRPWMPNQGADAERTVRVRAHVRGEALASVSLLVYHSGSSQQIPMALQGGDTYEATYVVPAGSPYMREIVVRVLATNSAGSAYGVPESVVQDGSPMPAPVITVVDGPARRGVPTKLKVEWPGAWTGFEMYCGTGEYRAPGSYRSDQLATCTYSAEGVYYVSATLFYLDSYKIGAYAELRVWDPYPLFAPVMLSGQ